jgi:hypothetical protein
VSTRVYPLALVRCATRVVPEPAPTLLDELEHRQNGVLRELDQLIVHIEQLVAAVQVTRLADRPQQPQSE